MVLAELDPRIDTNKRIELGRPHLEGELVNFKIGNSQDRCTRIWVNFFSLISRIFKKISGTFNENNIYFPSQHLQRFFKICVVAYIYTTTLFKNKGCRYFIFYNAFLKKLFDSTIVMDATTLYKRFKM